MANDSVTLLSEGKDKVGFTDLVAILQEHAPDSLTSSETFRLRDDGENCQIKTHSGFSNPLNPGHKILGEAEAVKQLKKAIEVELGTGAGDRVFNAARLEKPNAVKGTEIAALQAAFETVKQQISEACQQKNAPAVRAWAEAGQAGGIPENKAARQNLAELLQDKNVKWKVADSGSGGALLAFNADGTGAVVKIEGVESGQKGQALSNLMAETFGRTNACQVAQVETAAFQQSPESRGALVKKLKELVKENDQNPGALKTLKKHQLAMAGKDAVNMGMLKMDFVAGTQLNKLPLEEKAALLHSGVLAKEIGKAAVLFPAVGLCDHVSPSKSSLYDDTREVNGLPTNLSNLMIDKGTGKVSPIDFDTQNIQDGFGVRNASNGVLALGDFVARAAGSQQQFEEVMNRMAQDQASTTSVKSPLCDSLRSLTCPAAGEGLFSTSEAPAVQAVISDPALLRSQAVNMLQGALDGLEHLKTNIALFETAFQQTGNGMTQNDVQALKAGLQSLDIGTLRQNLNTFSVAQPQVDVQMEAGDIEPAGLGVADLAPPPPAVNPESVRANWNAPQQPRAGQRGNFLAARPVTPPVNGVDAAPAVAENDAPPRVGRPVPPPRPARNPPAPVPVPAPVVPVATGNTQSLRTRLAGQIQFGNPQGVPPPNDNQQRAGAGRNVRGSGR